MSRGDSSEFRTGPGGNQFRLPRSPWPSVVHTRTVHTIDPANPYLTCQRCGAWVDHFSHTGEDEGPVRNQPCDHAAGSTSICPSWGPVDECRCQEHLGYVPHAEPAGAAS